MIPGILFQSPILKNSISLLPAFSQLSFRTRASTEEASTLRKQALAKHVETDIPSFIIFPYFWAFKKQSFFHSLGTNSVNDIQ